MGKSGMLSIIFLEGTNSATLSFSCSRRDELEFEIKLDIGQRFVLNRESGRWKRNDGS